MQQLKKEIYEKAKKLVVFKGEDNWGCVRDHNPQDIYQGNDPRYKMAQVDYSFGKRICMIPKNQQINELLQASRGLSESSFEEASIDDYLNVIEKRMKNTPKGETERVEDLVSFLSIIDEKWCSKKF